MNEVIQAHPDNGSEVASAVCIAIISDYAARYTDFTISLRLLSVPEEDTSFIFVKGTAITQAYNNAWDEAIRDDEHRRVKWLWLMNDDHTFQPDLLHHLIGLDLPVVVPLVLKRALPFTPVLYTGQAADGSHIVLDLNDAVKTAADEDSAVIEVYAAGAAGMLIRRDVLEALGPSPFERSADMGDDLKLCQKIRKAGFAIRADLSVAMGHLNTVAVWPEFNQAGWNVKFDFGDGCELVVPRAGIEIESE